MISFEKGKAGGESKEVGKQWNSMGIKVGRENVNGRGAKYFLQ
jgi:hypothetical protein